MAYRPWRKKNAGGYGGEVPLQAFAPLPRPAALDGLVGKWVGMIDNEVVAAAESSYQLALQLDDMDHRRRKRVVVEYVRPNTDTYIVGVG